MMGWRLPCVALVLAACSIEPDLGTCGDLLCPHGYVCTVGGCATQEAAAPCTGKLDGEACMNASIAAGTCSGGSCHPVGCGNGILDAGEACDDGNQTYADGCAADCRSTEVCGNGVTDVLLGEDCDDGGVRGLSGDGCSSTCKLEVELWRDVSPQGLTGRVDSALAFDAARGVSVLFGGVGISTYGDTWEWDGVSWRQRKPVTSPPVRTNHVMAYDGKRVVLFGGLDPAGHALGDTWVWDGVTWSERVVATPPPARADAAMAYAPFCDCVVLFGGHSGTSYLGDTWKWDGSQWTLAASAGAPARSGGAAAYDPVTQKLLVAGGLDGSGFVPDAWAWDGTTWTVMTSSPPTFNRPTMVGDATNSRVVLFGGYSNGSSSASYVWNGSTWTPLVGTVLPSPRYQHAMTFDSARGRAVLFGGWDTERIFADTWELGATAWVDRTPAPTPGLVLHSMVYDARRGRAVMFGYSGVSTMNSLLEWDGVGWIPRATDPASSPTRRAGHAMAYDPGNSPTAGRTVVYGGFDGNTTLGETWLWDGNAWSPGPAGPPARQLSAMAYTADRDRVILFGGLIGSSAVDDTWEWNGATWAPTTPATRPPARAQHALAYDPIRRRVVLFGGYSSALATNLGDTWEWDGATWLETTPQSPSPSPRSGHVLTYDPERKRVVLYGGSYSNETWEWDGATWTRRMPLVAPEGRNTVAMTYDTIRHRVLAFGGDLENGLRTNDTWTRGFEPIVAAQERCVVASEDSDGDGLAGCDDPDCIGRCAPLCIPGESCDLALPRCGDGACGPVEDYLICPADCTQP